MKYILFLLPFLSYAQELNIYTLGLSYHGKNITSSNIAKKIPYKIDSKGNLTYHPEVSFLFQSNKSSTVYGLTYLKNTFFNDAFMASVGQLYNVSQNSKIGFLISLYLYEKEAEVLQPNIIQTEKYGLIVFPWIAWKHNIPISKKTSLSFMTISNFFLTHAAFGLSTQL